MRGGVYHSRPLPSPAIAAARMSPIVLSIVATVVAVAVAVLRTRPVMQVMAAGDAVRVKRATLLAGAFAVAGMGLLTMQAAAPIIGDQFMLLQPRMGLALLAGFLAAAVATDLDSYEIPDAITIPGTLAGVLFGIGGGIKLLPLHLDITSDQPIAEWMIVHPHWHGLASSLAGAAAGLAATLALRKIASDAMGQEAMGAGDATLMMMAGSFIGWQLTLLTLLAAPVLALAFAVAVKLLTGRTYVAFGPYLALAAWLLVVFLDRVYVGQIALLFSDPPLLAGTIAFLLGGTGGLLWLLQRLRGGNDGEVRGPPLN